jgi:hypothetical protein
VRAARKPAGFREVGVRERLARPYGEWLDAVIAGRLIPESQR